MCGRNLITGLTSAASPRVDISSTCKVGQKLGVSLPLLTCSPRRNHRGYCTAEVGNSGGTDELPCIYFQPITHLLSKIYMIIFAQNVSAIHNNHPQGELDTNKALDTKTYRRQWYLATRSRVKRLTYQCLSIKIELKL